MAITANKTKPRELIKAKRYKATLIGIYDIGHRDGQYGPYHQVVFGYELHDKKGLCTNNDGDPIVISAFLDVVLTKGKEARPSPLSEHLGALLGHPVDEQSFAVDDSLLEKGVELTVVHEMDSKKTLRDKIGSIIALDEDDAAPTPTSDTLYYEIPRDESSPAKIKPALSQEIPDGVPEWVQNQIKGSIEFGGKGGKAKARPAREKDADPDDDDIPF